MNKNASLEKIQSWAKRKGFVFQSSEIYGGFAAVYDYGHYGTLLKNNIQQLWWKNMVLDRDDVVGLDSGIFMHPMTWKASGHIDNFDDPLVECRTCHERMRADDLLVKHDINADKWSLEDLNKALDNLRADKKLRCEKCGGSDLTEAKQFNLMVRTNFGSPTEQINEENIVYPRAETCQGIYLNFKNIIDSTRQRPPFGIAQVGKAFRNEIVARQFIFRTREFEQMELQYFLHPKDMDAKFEYWKKERMNWHIEVLGISKEDLKFHEHEKLAHYASAAFDIEYNFKCLGGFAELEGIHQRGDWDLSQHQKFSGKNLIYRDPVTGEKYIPNIMETSIGLTRTFLMVIDNAYTEEDLGDGKMRTVMKFAPRVAPIKAAILPLQKDEKLLEKSNQLYRYLKENLDEIIEFDNSGNIGKSYRRQDEIGTPVCFTVDYQTLEDGSVTFRDRDTMQQNRIAYDQILRFLSEKYKYRFRAI